MEEGNELVIRELALESTETEYRPWLTTTWNRTLPIGAEHRELSGKHIIELTKLNEFIVGCNKAGYTNNSSLAKLKLNEAKDPQLRYWVIEYNNNIMALSGCQHLPEVSEKTYRLLFRGAQLPSMTKWWLTMSRYHFNSLVFYYHIPLQVAWARKQGGEDFVITTHTGSPSDLAASGRMRNMYKVFCLLEKQKLVEHVVTMELYGIPQAVWRLNLDMYTTLKEKANLVRNYDVKV